MIKPIIVDKSKLRIPCDQVDMEECLCCAEDLLDTANSLYSKCAGLAANQIGYSQRVITVKLSTGFIAMIDPIILAYVGKLKSGNESCLSEPYTMKKPVEIKRYYKIRLKYFDINGVEQIKTFKNFFARVVQHEIDHLNGKLIGDKK